MITFAISNYLLTTNCKVYLPNPFDNNILNAEELLEQETFTFDFIEEIDENVQLLN